MERTSSFGEKDDQNDISILPTNPSEESQRKNPLSSSSPEKRSSKRSSIESIGQTKSRMSEPKTESPRVGELKKGTFVNVNVNVKQKKRQSNSSEDGSPESNHSPPTQLSSEPNDILKESKSRNLKGRHREPNSQSLSPDSSFHLQHPGRIKDTLDVAMDEKKRQKAMKNHKAKEKNGKPRHHHPISDFYVVSSKVIGQYIFKIINIIINIIISIIFLIIINV